MYSNLLFTNKIIYIDLSYKIGIVENNVKIGKIVFNDNIFDVFEANFSFKDHESEEEALFLCFFFFFSSLSLDLFFFYFFFLCLLLSL